jgi:hypothetical protein
VNIRFGSAVADSGVFDVDGEKATLQDSSAHGRQCGR